MPKINVQKTIASKVAKDKSGNTASVICPVCLKQSSVVKTKSISWLGREVTMFPDLLDRHRINRKGARELYSEFDEFTLLKPHAKCADKTYLRDINYSYA